LKVNANKHIVELQKDRDLWKDRCTQMVRGIRPVLDLLDLGLPSEEPQVQQFMKEAREFAGAHVLSMVRAHYPLIDFTRFAKATPRKLAYRKQESYGTN
jgi:hypothetical protein